MNKKINIALVFVFSLFISHCATTPEGDITMGLFYKDQKRVQKGFDNKANLEGKNYTGTVSLAIQKDFDLDTIKKLIDHGADFSPAFAGLTFRGADLSRG